MSDRNAITAITEAIKILRGANLNPTALVLDKEAYEMTKDEVLSSVIGAQNVPYTSGISINNVRILEDIALIARHARR